MGLPQPLVDALREIEPAERFNPMETFRQETAESPRKELTDFRLLVQDLETRPAKIKNAVHALLQRSGEDIAAGELDQAIELLAEHEEELRKRLPHLEAVRELKAGAFSYPIAAADRSLFVSVCERWIRAFLNLLEALRDLRWELLAFRTEAEDPGDAPVFDNPSDLLGYLKALPKYPSHRFRSAHTYHRR